MIFEKHSLYSESSPKKEVSIGLEMIKPLKNKFFFFKKCYSIAEIKVLKQNKLILKSHAWSPSQNEFIISLPCQKWGEKTQKKLLMNSGYISISSIFKITFQTFTFISPGFKKITNEILKFPLKVFCPIYYIGLN